MSRQGASQRVAAAIEVVDQALVRIAEAQPNERVRSKLRLFHETCGHLVLKARVRLTVTGVVRAYGAKNTEPSLSIAEQSIRNDRPDGANPYKDLYRAWQGVQEVVLGRKPRKVSWDEEASASLVDDEELSGIKDEALRHRVLLMFAKIRNLKNENDILRRASTAAPLALEGTEGAALAVGRVDFNATDLDVVKSLLDQRQLKFRRLTWAKDGSLITVQGMSLSDPGLLEVLTKIAEADWR